MGISKHELIPVPLAARIVYQRAYGAAPPETHLDERLNGLAYRLARHGRVYAIPVRGAPPRQLSREEMACGVFRHGGRELHFLDERAPLVHIGVTQDCIDKAVRALLLNQAALP